MYFNEQTLIFFNLSYNVYSQKNNLRQQRFTSIVTWAAG